MVLSQKDCDGRLVEVSVGRLIFCAPADTTEGFRLVPLIMYSPTYVSTLLALMVLVNVTASFIVCSEPPRALLSQLRSERQDGGRSVDEGQRKQEKLLETMSLLGAEEIAKMNVSERTTRAMLAEAVEDRIFQLQDNLEQLSGGEVPVDESVKAQCVEIAKDIRRSQIQYNELVSGAQSDLLDSMKSWEQTTNVKTETEAKRSGFE